MKRIGLKTSAKRKLMNKVKSNNDTESDRVIEDSMESPQKRKDIKSKSKKI